MEELSQVNSASDAAFSDTRFSALASEEAVPPVQEEDQETVVVPDTTQDENVKHGEQIARRRPPPPMGRPRFIYRVFKAKSDLPGQRGLNPCCYFAKCCMGTCTLKTGCIVLGSFLLCAGLSGILRIIFHVTFGLEHFAVEDPRDNIPNLGDDGVSLTETVEAKSITEILGYIHGNAAIASLDLMAQILFLFIPGVTLLIAARQLNKHACIAYIALILIGILYCLILWSGITIVVVVADIEGIDAAGKIVYLLCYWLFLLAYEAFQLYAFLCGYALLRQIRYGEYNSEVVILSVEPMKPESGGDAPDE